MSVSVMADQGKVLSSNLVVNQITVRSCYHHKQTILEFIWIRDPPKGPCVVALVLTGVLAFLQKQKKWK